MSTDAAPASPLRNVRLTIEYDGTAYHGWQRQTNGLAVQQVLEEALERMVGPGAGVSGGRVAITAAGRTDAGVHAAAQVCHFHTTATLPLRAFVLGLNTYLPPDIAVKDAAEAPPDFHARRSARGKRYRYTVWEAPVRSALRARTAWWVRPGLDREAMRGAALPLVGEHDFSAFRGQGCEAKTSVRVVRAIELGEPEPGLLVWDVSATAFLKHMVRNIIGTLVHVGRGKMTPAGVAAALESRDRRRAGPTAPPQGLCLMEVFY